MGNFKDRVKAAGKAAGSTIKKAGGKLLKAGGDAAMKAGREHLKKKVTQHLPGAMTKLDNSSFGKKVQAKAGHSASGMLKSAYDVVK